MQTRGIAGTSVDDLGSFTKTQFGNSFSVDTGTGQWTCTHIFTPDQSRLDTWNPGIHVARTGAGKGTPAAFAALHREKASTLPGRGLQSLLIELECAKPASIEEDGTFTAQDLQFPL